MGRQTPAPILCLVGLLACGTSLPAVAQPATATPLVYQQPLLNPAVSQVQERLRDQGAYGGAVDGVWGADSATALSQFQQSRGLQATGQLNQATALVLGLSPTRLLGLDAAATPAQTQPQPPPPSPPPAPAATAPAVPAPDAAPAAPPSATTVLGLAAVRNLQGRLRDLGYYTGGIDGQWGPQAEAALRRFQQASGIAVSGRINRETVAAMGLDPNDPAAPARP